MKSLFKYLIAAAAAVGLTMSAYAIPTLTIFDGTTTITVTDGSASDTSSAAGQVSFSGSIGNWTATVDTGTTKPVIGSATSPEMDLSFNATSNDSGGFLNIRFSDDGFTKSGSVADEIGGTQVSGGTVIDNVWKNFDPRAENTPIASIGPLSGSPFGGTATGSVTLTSSDVLTLEVVISHNGSGITTGNKHVSVPDGGATALLLGLGLLGVGLAARRFKKA